MNILWATTFSADLWEHSGKLLIDSFVATKTPGTLVAYVEGMDIPKTPNVIQHRLDDDPFLAKFLETHKEVIPSEMGGKAMFPVCTCKGGPYGPHVAERHKLPCVGYWFCKNAFRWLRKPLSAKYACDRYGDEFDIMMWVDADASFLKTIPPDVVWSWFRKRYGCIYLKNKRTAIETGVFGYHMKLGGRRIADAVLERYSTGKFRRDQRWDDCVQMELGIKASKIPALDIATKVGPRNTVIQFSPLAPYLGHDKGRHNRTGKLK